MLQTARAETRAAEARIELAQRERFPVPSIGVGRTWTSGPFGAANFLGVSSAPCACGRQPPVPASAAIAAACSATSASAFCTPTDASESSASARARS